MKPNQTRSTVHTAHRSRFIAETALAELNQRLRMEQPELVALRAYALIELIQATTPQELLTHVAAISSARSDEAAS